MKIAILGYGKMGKNIEQLALERGHEIVVKITSENKVDNIDFSDIDVSIDFSTPSSAYNNINASLLQSTPVVSGTTGWLEKRSIINQLAVDNKTAFLYASNFSIGVNLFFELNKNLAKLMKNHDEYQAKIKEIHHIHKLDAPSGTAITLSEHLNANVRIESERESEVPGTHIVSYESEVDFIEIKHKALNRKGFALGAILAAEWVVGKKGVFSMSDMLKF